MHGTTASPVQARGPMWVAVMSWRPSSWPSSRLTAATWGAGYTGKAFLRPLITQTMTGNLGRMADLVVVSVVGAKGAVVRNHGAIFELCCAVTLSLHSTFRNTCLVWRQWDRHNIVKLQQVSSAQLLEHRQGKRICIGHFSHFACSQSLCQIMYCWLDMGFETAAWNELMPRYDAFKSGPTQTTGNL